MHNKVSYTELKVAEDPTDPALNAITQTPLPGEVAAKGAVASTRQELAAPMELGPLKLVPYLSGEASYYGEDVTGDSLTRLIGQAGIRSTLPICGASIVTCKAVLLNVRGLAHKVEFVSDLFYADSSNNLEDLPSYDALDDDAQEDFAVASFLGRFGRCVTARFDPRNYAYRQGMQRYITNPSEVIADDALQARLGVHQRWQTKRGVPGRERIVDYCSSISIPCCLPNGS